MKEETIVNAFMLEELSPRAYADVVYNIKHKIKPSQYCINEILTSFDTELFGNKINELKYNKIVKIIKERLKFERKIEKVRTLARQVKE